MKKANSGPIGCGIIRVVPKRRPTNDNDNNTDNDDDDNRAMKLAKQHHDRQLEHNNGNFNDEASGRNTNRFINAGREKKKSNSNEPNYSECVLRIGKGIQVNQIRKTVSYA